MKRSKKVKINLPFEIVKAVLGLAVIVSLFLPMFSVNWNGADKKFEQSFNIFSNYKYGDLELQSLYEVFGKSFNSIYGVINSILVVIVALASLIIVLNFVSKLLGLKLNIKQISKFCSMVLLVGAVLILATGYLFTSTNILETNIIVTVTVATYKMQYGLYIAAIGSLLLGLVNLIKN